MKNWQFCYMMWALMMICYYVSDKHWGPLIMANFFQIAGIACFFYYIYQTLERK